MTVRLDIETIAWGDFDENTYIVGSESSCLIFDPGAPAHILMPLVAGRKVEAILLTHTHFDHIAGADEIRDATGAPLYAPVGESTGLEDPDVNLSALFAMNLRQRPADRVARPGDTITIGETAFTAHDTAGHSPGHLSWVATLPVDQRHGGSGCVVIAGDALFAGAVGRTDLPGASHERLIRAIQKELMILPDDTIVYPGHGPKTTIGTEKKYNPFLGGDSG